MNKAFKSKMKKANEIISNDKFAKNLKKLKDSLPTKPLIYTNDYPRSIAKSLKLYCNKRTVYSIQFATKCMNEENWPLPLWVNPTKVRVGLLNKIFYKKYQKLIDSKRKVKKMTGLDFLSIPTFRNLTSKTSYLESIDEAFDINLKYIEQKLVSNSLLIKKEIIIKECFTVYRSKNWIACICTIFPLIDSVTRKLLNSTDLKVTVGKIYKLFEQNGLGNNNLDNLMPIVAFSNYFNQKDRSDFNRKMSEFEKLFENDFGIIGAALNSAMHFANSYYSVYKEENGDTDILNRHAIIHGSTTLFGTKENAIKLFSFLFLLLELEPVFKILLDKSADNVII